MEAQIWLGSGQPEARMSGDQRSCVRKWEREKCGCSHRQGVRECTRALVLGRA